MEAEAAVWRRVGGSPARSRIPYRYYGAVYSARLSPSRAVSSWLWMFIYLLPGARGPRNAHDSEAHAGQGQTKHTSKGPKHATNTRTTTSSNACTKCITFGPGGGRRSAGRARAPSLNPSPDARPPAIRNCFGGGRQSASITLNGRANVRAQLQRVGDWVQERDAGVKAPAKSTSLAG